MVQDKLMLGYVSGKKFADMPILAIEQSGRTLYFQMKMIVRDGESK